MKSKCGATATHAGRFANSLNDHGPPGAVNPGRKDKAMRNILRMWYYLPGQSEIFSEPQMFETRDGKAWERAVSIAHEKGYKIVKVERVK